MTLAASFKDRLRTDIKAAMKARDGETVKLLRALVSALDQAEAPPAVEGPYQERDFADGTAEVARIDLDAAAIAAVIAGEAAELSRGAEEFERLGMAEKAQQMRGAAAIVESYLQKG